MRGGRAVQYGARHIGRERLELFHPEQRDAAQAQQLGGLRVAEKQRDVFVQFGFDLVVIGQPIARDAGVAEQLTRSLAFGGGVVEPVFGDQAGAGDRDFLADALGIE